MDVMLVVVENEKDKVKEIKHQRIDNLLIYCRGQQTFSIKEADGNFQALWDIMVSVANTQLCCCVKAAVGDKRVSMNVFQ